MLHASVPAISTKWSFWVLSTTRNAPNIHPSNDSILQKGG